MSESGREQRDKGEGLVLSLSHSGRPGHRTAKKRSQSQGRLVKMVKYTRMNFPGKIDSYQILTQAAEVSGQDD